MEINKETKAALLKVNRQKQTFLTRLAASPGMIADDNISCHCSRCRLDRLPPRCVGMHCPLHLPLPARPVLAWPDAAFCAAGAPPHHNSCSTAVYSSVHRRNQPL